MIAWKRSTTGEMYPTFKIQINMTDLDVLVRAKRIAAAGTNPRPIKKEKAHHKQAYSYSINKRADVKRVIEAIYHLLGERRRTQADCMMKAMSEHPPRPKWKHGTRQGYEKGCRCRSCKAAHAARHRVARARRRIRAACT